MPSASRFTKIPIVYISYRQYRRIDLSLRMLRRDYPRNDASYLSVRNYIYICMYVYLPEYVEHRPTKCYK